MFGIGMPEMLLILVVALVVFGPRRLPELAESIGRAVARLRAATGAVQSQVEKEVRAAREAASATPPEPALAAPEGEAPGQAGPADPAPPRNPPQASSEATPADPSMNTPDDTSQPPPRNHPTP